MLNQLAPFEHKETPDGIFLTHAHIGHYSGLMFLGKEAMDADSVPVFCMPRMKTFLTNNGPWSQLVSTKNITLLKANKGGELDTIFSKKRKYARAYNIGPQTVPHRDEYSETVGYFIAGGDKTTLFIPDIDKWEKWTEDIIELIPNLDYAFLDGTFTTVTNYLAVT